MNAGAARYIRYVLGELRVSPSALAKEAGVASTTLTRFLNSPDYKFTISTTTIAKIAKASGINPAPFFEAKSEADIGKLAYYDTEKVYDDTWPPSLPKDDDKNSTTVIIGEVAAGQWREMEIADIMQHAPLPMRLSFYRSEDTFAMIVRGESLNKIAKDGDYLVCIRRDAMKWSYRTGDLAIVQRTRDGGRMIEVTAKKLKEGGGGWELWPVSDDPRFQAPIEMSTLEDSLEISLIGVVELVLRYPR